MTKNWLPSIGLAIVATLLAGAFQNFGLLRDLFILLAICLFAVGAVLKVKSYWKGRYDLGELKRVHEIAELDAIDVPEPLVFDSVRCASCGSVYRMELSVCPRCKRSQFQ